MRRSCSGRQGVIGRALLPELARATRWSGSLAVHIATRTGSRGHTPTSPKPTRCTGSSREGDVVVYLVHSPRHVRLRACRSVGGGQRCDVAAGSASARRIVYLGGLGGGEEADSRHLRSRDETAARLTFGAVPVTTLRAAMVVGPGGAAFETIRALVDRLPAMVCPRWVSTPTQPIALDVVGYLVGACGLEVPRGGNRTTWGARRS